METQEFSKYSPSIPQVFPKEIVKKIITKSPHHGIHPITSFATFSPIIPQAFPKYSPGNCKKKKLPNLHIMVFIQSHPSRHCPLLFPRYSPIIPQLFPKHFPSNPQEIVKKKITKSPHHGIHPITSFPTRGTLSTGLMLVKQSQSCNGFHNVSLFIHNNNSSCAQACLVSH